MHRMFPLASALAGMLVAASCSVSSESADAGDGGPRPTDVSADADTANTSDATGGIDARAVHEFPKYPLDAGEEVIYPCAQWTLDNEEPLYVNEVTLANGGGYHHSNWFVVPEDYAPGEDGYFNCSDRGFTEVGAATRGTVLFAQSTQAKSESQKFEDGAVIKIPPHHKIVGDVHMLNVTTRKVETFARMSLGLVHPRYVDVVLTPFRLTYHDLHIPPKTESRFTAECNFEERYPGDELDFQLYYVLPHYHELGTYFGLEIFGGPRDGEQLYELKGFNAEANGHTFPDPIDLTGARGLRFTCGYDNPRDETVGWGFGGKEMCVMLGFADSEILMDATVQEGDDVARREDGVVYKEGRCTVVPFEKPDSQSPPTEEEKEGDLYVPESDEDVEPIPSCEEISEPADPLRAPTLSNLHRDVFSVTCSFSACHGAENAAAGLNLETLKDLHGRLLNHELKTPTDDPLVTPGKPSESWLYRVTSTCEPQSSAGPVAHMPRNSPTLMEPRMVAMIREWIERGAKDN